jgi:putative MATE family efflux protein
VNKSGNVAEQPPAVPKDWTKGSITRNLLLLSWPVLVLSALYSANLVLEMVWVGKLGESAIAGVGVAGFILLVVVSAKSSLSFGERAMVARHFGAGDLTAANHVAGQAFVISGVYGVVVSVAVFFLTPQIFGLFGLEAGAAAEGVKYLRLVMAGWLTEAFWISSFSVMQASGDTLTPMKIAIFIRCVNALVCPFLVLGLWIFPRMGVTGAAATYILVTGLGMSLSLWVLLGGKTRVRLRLKDFRPDPVIIWRILKIGIPASITGLGKTFGDLVLTRFVVPFGTVPLAAHNVISRIESFLTAPSAGLGTGAAVLVGQNLGAKQPRQATRSGWLAVVLVLAIMVVFAAVLWIFAARIIALFNSDPKLVETGSTFLRIAVSGYVAMSAVNVLQNCIYGAGDTLPPMLISLTMVWIFQLPLAFLISRHTTLGVFGIRWAVVISLVLGAAAYAIYFRLERWKRMKI